MLGDGDKGGRDGMEGFDTLGAGESCSLIDTSAGDAARPEEFAMGDVVAPHAGSSFIGNGGFIEGKPSKYGAVMLL